MVSLLRWLSFIILTLLSTHLYAQSILMDVYGTDPNTAEKIIKTVGPDLEIVGELLLQRAKDTSQDEKRDKEIARLKSKIMNDIHQVGDFTYVKFSPIIYQDMTMCITIDLIGKKDQKRLSYISEVSFKPTKEILSLNEDKEINRLLHKWITYEKTGFDLMFQGKPPIIKHRPAYHCVFGFDDPKLKPYLAIFEKEVPKNKKKLITILRADPDEERRKTAAFLLAHIKDGQELIKILTPSLSDPSGSVRNNVMRVLGETIGIVKPTNFDINPIIRALDFPEETDRNKALYMINSLCNQPKYAHYIAQHASVPLMASLRMTQPNLHNNAYVILRQISGKSYDERDYASWEAWFAQQAVNSAKSHLN